MKRQILTLITVLALLATGAVFAQSTLNTPAPGPSQETKPGQTNNNLQNPGNPQMQQQEPPAVRENGTVEGTAAESNARTDQTGTTSTTTGTTGTMDNTTGTTGTTGTMNNMDQTGTPPTTTTTTTTTDTTTTGTTGTYNSTTGTTTTGGSMDNTDTSATSDTLPNTASDLPTLALMGLLALSAFFALRIYAKRQA